MSEVLATSFTDGVSDGFRRDEHSNFMIQKPPFGIRSLQASFAPALFRSAA
jgi:hypothetical protein